MATWRELSSSARTEGLPAHEIRIVLAEVAGMPYSRLAAHLDDEVAPEIAAREREIVTTRSSGVPLQHALGHWSFRTLELTVDRRALIPRPETELLVEVGLRELSRVRDATGRRSLRALDLGTGSAAIAASLVAEDDAVTVVGTDRSLEALELAKTNRAGLEAAARRRLVLVASDWFGAFAARPTFDLIVANPPYLSSAEWDELPPVVRSHDPRPALVAGATGLEDLDRICEEAAAYLAPDGTLAMELAPHQAELFAGHADALGAVVEIKRDLTGRDRIAVVRW